MHDDLLANLNAPQTEAVAHVDGPLLVLAGAGSGKTRVITRRVANLVRRGVAPWNVLAITFTNKAAEEMRRRVEALDTPRGATLCTFHSLCARLLREFAPEARIDPNYSIYDRDDQTRTVREAMTRAGIPAHSLAAPHVHAKISAAKNRLQTASAFAEAAEKEIDRRIARVYIEYEKLLAANNALDFDDLLLRVAFMLRDHRDIRDLLGRRYRYVMIDEYQDTNHAQYLLARAITLQHRNLCVTGDPDQSIYAWRGADITNILEFESDYPDARVIHLEENYRSTPAILHGASRLIAHNVRRKEKALWTSRTGGRNVRVVYCDDAKGEAAWIADRVAELRAGGTPCEAMAVFYRINSLSRMIEQTLMRAGIPYRVARGVEFYNRKEVKDVLAYLKVLANPRDDVSCLRIINVPARGIGAATVRRLADRARRTGESILDICAHGADAGLKTGAAKKARAFAELIEMLHAEIDGPVKRIVNAVIDRTAMADALKEDDKPDTSAWRNVTELVSIAAEFDRDHEGGTLVEFLQQVSLASDTDHFDGGDGAVTLMTLHAAKGLEFPVVFIVAWERGLLPFRRDDRPIPWPLSAEAEYEEERRLAFVGMTRAMDELTLLCARKRMVRGRSASQSASPFLAEIGREFVTVEDATTPEESERPRRWSRAGGGFYEGAPDDEQRRIIEAMQDAADDDAPYMPPEYEHLAAGCPVSHPKFGIGRVTKVGAQGWPETRVEVFFVDVGPKTLVLQRANLELLDPDS